MRKAMLLTTTALAASVACAQTVERKFSELFEQRSTAMDIIVQVADDEVLVFDGQADARVFQVRGRTLYIIAKRSRVDGAFRLDARDQIVVAGNPDLVADKAPFDQPASRGAGGANVGECQAANNGGPGSPGAPGDGGDPGKTGSTWVVDIESLEGDGTLELFNVGGRGGKGQQGQTGGKGGQAGRGGNAKGLPPDDCGGYDAGEPGDGGQAGAGGIGGTGGQGGKTLLSPELQKAMTNVKPKIVVSVMGGPGGDGGDGGIGGDGGDGNDGGSGDGLKDGGRGVAKKPKQPDKPKASNGLQGPDGQVAVLEDSPVAFAAAAVIAPAILVADTSIRPVAAGQTTKSFSTSWVSAARYAPCQGIGAAGTFRVYAAGDAIVATDKTRKVTSLTVYASSATFTQAAGSIAARAIIKHNGSTVNQVVLTPPTPPVVEPAPKADEARRVYLPAGKTLTLAIGDQLHVEASAIAGTPSGTCTLGSSTSEIPLQ